MSPVGDLVLLAILSEYLFLSGFSAAVGATALFRIFRHTLQFFSYMMAVNFYWWKREPRYIIKCILEETTDLPQVN
jgi:hypothetical protein